jgi:putative transposase
MPIPLIAPDFSQEEESAEFQAFQRSVTQDIQQELAVNANIPHTDFCTIPEAEVHLPTEHGKTTFRRQFQVAYTRRPAVDAKLKQWLKDGVIETVNMPSTFNTPLLLIPKKDATGAKTDFRICHDFRPLNELLPNDAWPLPLISDIFEALAGAQVFSTLDLHQAYHRFPIAVGDRYKTAFTWNGVQYQFRGAPFGLKTLPSHFQRVMTLLFHDLEYVRVFIDDIVVFSKAWSDHAAHLKEVIRRLNQAKLILNVSKCHFARLEVELPMARFYGSLAPEPTLSA